jgi:5-methyltetrahydropteroyltriglutamate--homocysteine methyltransferase
MENDFKYRVHHHASMVVPPELAQARADDQAGDQVLAEVLKSAIAETLHKQACLGLAVLSDGEFRRRNALSPVYDTIDGFGAPGASTPVAELVGSAHAPEVRTLTTTPAARGRLVPEEGAQLGAMCRPTMIALPSPGYLTALTGVSGAFAEILRTEITALADEGVDYVLLRNPALAFLLVQQGRATAEKLGINPAATIATVLDEEVAAVADLDVPACFRVGFDLTTAGQARGPWDHAAVRSFLAAQPFSRLCIDFPAEDRFPLELVPFDLHVSLGIVDIASPSIEDFGELVDRVDDADRLIGADDISLSTNGGFHLVGDAAAPYAYDKLRLVESVASLWWSDDEK